MIGEHQSQVKHTERPRTARHTIHKVEQDVCSPQKQNPVIFHNLRHTLTGTVTNPLEGPTLRLSDLLIIHPRGYRI